MNILNSTKLRLIQIVASALPMMIDLVYLVALALYRLIRQEVRS